MVQSIKYIIFVTLTVQILSVNNTVKKKLTRNKTNKAQRKQKHQGNDDSKKLKKKEDFKGCVELLHKGVFENEHISKVEYENTKNYQSKQNQSIKDLFNIEENLDLNKMSKKLRTLIDDDKKIFSNLAEKKKRQEYSDQDEKSIEFDGKKFSVQINKYYEESGSEQDDNYALYEDGEIKANAIYDLQGSNNIPKFYGCYYYRYESEEEENEQEYSNEDEEESLSENELNSYDYLVFFVLEKYSNERILHTMKLSDDDGFNFYKSILELIINSRNKGWVLNGIKLKSFKYNNNTRELSKALFTDFNYTQEYGEENTQFETCYQQVYPMQETDGYEIIFDLFDFAVLVLANEYDPYKNNICFQIIETRQEYIDNDDLEGHENFKYNKGYFKIFQDYVFKVLNINSFRRSFIEDEQEYEDDYKIEDCQDFKCVLLSILNENIQLTPEPNQVLQKFIQLRKRIIIQLFL